MNRFIGDFTPGKTVRLTFNTNKADGTPITLAGTPVASVYKDSSTTETATGVTLTVDFDSRTGMHQVVVDTSADGTFYAAGSDFRAVLTAGTVDSISVVGAVVGGFSISNRSALRPTTADRTLDVASTGEAGLDFDNVKQATGATTLANIRVPNVTLADTVTTYTGDTPQTGDSFARIGANGSGLTAAGAVTLDGGTVSASPAPTTTTFTATGANLHGATGAYTSTPQQVRFSSGTLQGQRFAISAHVVSGSNHALTVATMPSAPTAADTFDIL